jgi:hypothetical protein
MFQNVRKNKSKFGKDEVNRNIYKLGHHLLKPYNGNSEKEVKKDPYEHLKEKLEYVSK